MDVNFARWGGGGGQKRSTPGRVVNQADPYYANLLFIGEPIALGEKRQYSQIKEWGNLSGLGEAGSEANGTCS